MRMNEAASIRPLLADERPRRQLGRRPFSKSRRTLPALGLWPNHRTAGSGQGKPCEHFRESERFESHSPKGHTHHLHMPRKSMT